MALIPALKQVEIASDGSYITVADATGDYSTTNPGGFGSPNPTSNDISTILLRLNYFASINTYITLKPDDFNPLFTAGGLKLFPSDFSGLFTGSIFLDGVYDIKYYIGYLSADLVSWEAGEQQFNMSNANVNFAAAVGFIVPSISETKIFFIDRTKAVTNSGAWVTEILPDVTTPVDVIIVYEGDFKTYLNKAGNNCLVADIALWDPNTCDDNFRNIWPRYQMKIAIEAKFTQGLYQDAHNLAVKLQSYCGDFSGGCGSCS